jgi:hypothetical protein
MVSTETTSMNVPIALIVGVTPKRIADQIRTGSGCGDSPVVKNDSTKSSNESANTSSPAARIAGHSAGSVIRRNVSSRVAPRSIAASSTSCPRAASRARTTTVTYEIENVMWPRMIVVSDSWRPTWVNTSSAETPATISGVTSGTSIRMFSPPLQRVRERTRPYASSVPMMVATTIVTSAIWTLAARESRSDSDPKNCSYQRRLKPSKF